MHNNSFNIIQLSLAIAFVGAAGCVLIACGNDAGQVFDIDKETDIKRNRMRNSTQLRGIHQALVTYANSNNGFFPGLDEYGEPVAVTGHAEGIDVEARLQLLLEGQFVLPEYLISPSENDQSIKLWGQGQGPLTNKHYSYALMEIKDGTGRREEWNWTLNSEAIVLSDRNTGSPEQATSIHTTEDEPGWIGSVLWNDNHVNFETTTTFETRYANGEFNTTDNLFVAEGGYDAMQMHSGS